jgi:hypothetical protein
MNLLSSFRATRAPMPSIPIRILLQNHDVNKNRGVQEYGARQVFGNACRLGVAP